MKWKILSSQYVFKDLWFKVRKDICETESGKIINPYYVYEFPNWVMAVPVTEDGKIILIRQYRHAIQEICLEIPGGCVDETDKDFQQAIERELLEETGYTFSSYEYLGRTSSNPSTNNNMAHMFLAKGGRKTSRQKLDTNEEIEVQLYTIDEVKQFLKQGKLIQSMHVATFLYAFEKMKELSY
jgi:ADP-ribose pyrophosphatase